ncbi:DNA double-strand break repair nuclease NurA [Candidatus Woesearchaeota archaeon]|nr:DNA double-strand break repair nuclease NurA [Candidatus Woesearchaeota archaeon]
MEEVIRHIVNSLNNIPDREDCPNFSDKSYKPLKIDKNNFHFIKAISSNKKIAFIDGGNAEIIKAANFSLHIIRVYYNVYLKNKKLKSKKHQSYVFLNAVNKNNKINYEAEIFNNDLNLNKEDLIFDSFDSTLRTGIHRVIISKIGEIARRFAELKLAEKLVEELDEGTIIVMDRDLQASITNEAKYFNLIYDKALKKDVTITGLCKSSNILTNNGNSINALLNVIGPENPWFYHPIVEITNENHKAEMFFIKLHEKSKHVFRFEIYDKQKANAEEVLSLLSDNSNDPIFPGYPYGLIEADRSARITNQEKEYQKTIFLAKIGRKLDSHLAAINAHDILDNII